MGIRVPTATYRIQFSRNFKFEAAKTLAPYLHDLGITDLYASPLFQARRGSLHGYSVTNPMQINPEIGSRSSFEALVRKLKAKGMGLLFDIVPNHMALSHENPWWMDVLENGHSSPYAIFFDIDWRPPNRVLEGKVLLPILGKNYNEVLEAQELRLNLEESGFFISYYDNKFPLDPKTYKDILSHGLADLEKNLGESHPAIIGLKGLVMMSEHLPARSLVSPKKARERQRDKEIIKKNLWLLYQQAVEVKEFIDGEGGDHPREHHAGFEDVHQEETAVCEIDGLRQGQVFARLGDGDDLGSSSGRGRHGDLVAGAGITVNRVDAPVAPDQLCESDRDIAGPGAHVHAAPSWLETEASERGRERSPVEVVAQPELAHRDDGTQTSPICRRRAGLPWRRESDDDAV